MKKIDRYIIQKFLGTFFFMLALIMLIAIVFDISERLDDFIKNSAPLKAIFLEYYVNFVIYYGNLFSALLVFITVILFTSKMASNTEIVAILSSGVSFNRLLFPYFVAATMLTALSFYSNHWLTPDANKSRLEFEENYIRNPYRNWNKNIHKQINPGEFIYFESYNNTKNIGYKFSFEKWEDKEMKYKLLSDYVRWDTVKQKWVITNYTIRIIDGMNETIKKGNVKDTLLNFKYDDFGMRLNSIESMKTDELDAFIEQEIKQGSDQVPFYLIERHQRTSYPFATYILTLIGVSIASRKVRGGIGLHIALGLLLCVSYILAMKVTTVYATNAGLDPLLAVWLPNLIFGVLALYLFRKAPK